jgi:Mg2+ and Co2+ transporter CorA
MISRYAYHGLTWIDLESPTREEMLHIGEEFGLSKLVEEELFSEHAPATLDLYDTYVYLTLLCPTVNDAGTVVSNHTLAVIIGKKFLITARKEKIEGLYSFASQFQHVEKMDQSKKILDGNTLFTELLTHIYAIAHKDLATISHRISTLEHSLYTANEQRMTKALFSAKRSLLSFKEGIAAHSGLLQSYTTAVHQLFGTDVGYIVGVTSEYRAAHSAIEARYEVLCAMQKTHTATIVSNTNSRIKTLTYLIIALLLATIILHFI